MSFRRSLRRSRRRLAEWTIVLGITAGAIAVTVALAWYFRLFVGLLR